MTGPQVSGKMAGVGFMVVGFVQNITSVLMSDTYTNLADRSDKPVVLNDTVVDALAGKPMLDLATRPGSRLPTGTVPWIDSQRTVALRGDVGTPTVPYPVTTPSTGHSGVLTTHDTPYFGLPTVTSQTVREPLPGGAGLRSVTFSLTSIDVIWNFTLFIAGMSTDSTAFEGTATTNAVFTAFGAGTWVFNGSGTMNNGTWSPIIAAPQCAAPNRHRCVHHARFYLRGSDRRLGWYGYQDADVQRHLDEQNSLARPKITRDSEFSMRTRLRVAIGVGLFSLPAIVLSSAGADAAVAQADCDKTVAAARATLGAWNIEDEPFGRVQGGLCLKIYTVPDDSLLEFALSNPDVQSLIKARRIVCFGARSLAKLSDAGLAPLRGIPDLKELILDADSSQTIDPCFSRLRKMAQLEALEIIGDLLRDDDLKSLQSLNRLRVLGLGTAVNLTGAGLSSLKDLRQLESLTLNANKLDDAGFENLMQWPDLLNLTLGEPWNLRESQPAAQSMVVNQAWMFAQKGPGPNVDRGMRSLGHLTNLRLLELNGVNITDAGLKPIRSLQRLETLHMAGFKLTEAGFANLEALKNLRSLAIRDMPTPGNALAHLAALPKLEELKLMRTNITGEEVVELAGLKNLKRLSIAKMGGGIFDIICSRAPTLSAALKPMQKLEELELSDYDGIDDYVLLAVAAHKDLKALRLAGTSISDDGLRLIAPLTGLQKLDISRPLHDTWITDAGMKYLKGLTRLQSLNLGGTNVTDKGIAELSALVELRHLVLPDGVSDAGVERLGSLRRLQDVTGGRHVTARGAKFLHDHCPQLQTAEFGAIYYVECGDFHPDGTP
jgi:Leucine-rich repeat (LRR) protein